MRPGRRIPDRPWLRMNAKTLNNLPGLVKTLSASHIGRSEPDPFHDAPDGYRRFNPVLRGPKARKLIDRIAGPPLKPGQVGGVRCSCCKERARRKGSLLCGWCAWLLQ